MPLLAAGLGERGLGSSDRAVIMVPMSLELYELVLACLHLGISAVFLDAWSSLGRLEAAAALAAPRAYFASALGRLLGLAVPHLRGTAFSATVHRSYFPLDRLRAGLPAPLFQAQAGHEALVTFTTGSTGAPKGAPRSHAFLLAQQQALKPVLGRRPDGPDMPFLPVFALFNLAQGVTTVLPEADPARPASIDAGALLKQMRGEGVATSSGSPGVFEALAGRGAIPLKKIFTGGAPVPPGLARLLCGAVQGEVQVIYGGTEAEPIAATAARNFFEGPASRRLGLPAGKPRGLRLKIIRPSDSHLSLGKSGWKGLELGPGRCGEIVVQGGHVQESYINDEQARARNKIIDGKKVWHRSGDAGYLAADGCLHLMGRVGQRVRRAGKTWWGLEAEKRAMQISGARFAVYLGIPDPALGQRALLCLESDVICGLDEARRLLKPWPVDELRIFRRIPRDPRHASKADWAKLQKKLA